MPGRPLILHTIRSHPRYGSMIRALKTTADPPTTFDAARRRRQRRMLEPPGRRRRAGKAAAAAVRVAGRLSLGSGLLTLGGWRLPFGDWVTRAGASRRAKQVAVESTASPAPCCRRRNDPLALARADLRGRPPRSTPVRTPGTTQRILWHVGRSTACGRRCTFAQLAKPARQFLP
jgi:hypothetical protein